MYQDPSTLEYHLEEGSVLLATRLKELNSHLGS